MADEFISLNTSIRVPSNEFDKFMAWADAVFGKYRWSYGSWMSASDGPFFKIKIVEPAIIESPEVLIEMLKGTIVEVG